MRILKQQLSAATVKIAFKAGVAALLAYLGAQGLGLRSPLWATISAVIVMQANLGSSFGAS